MKKNLLILLVVILSVGLYGFKTNNQQVIPVSTPFPQTGEITVYKYKMFNKEEIGKLIWVARTERKYNSQKDHYYSEINITVENKTSEFVEFSFDFTGEVSPHGTWRSGAKLSSEDCTGVEPTKKEITIS